jgi:uncharacterized Ntn-hydrolase superfamily protein
MTFSVVARDAANGDLGVAVQSRFLAVGAAVCHARAGVGAVATQALTNVTYGPRALTLLETGADAARAVDVLVSSDPLPERRQVAVVDAHGRVAAHTGSGCQPWAGHMIGDGFSLQGNILVSSSIVREMAGVMRERTDIPLPERLALTLEAGQMAGGDARGKQSAALLVVREGGGYGGLSDRLVDLRVDDHPEPIEELHRLLALHRTYFTRPSEDDLLEIDPALAREIAARLRSLLNVSIDQAEPLGLWRELERWAGRENLEERMVRPGTIDPHVLTILRERSGSS